MRWSRQYAFKMLIFQSILTGGDMFGYSLSITCGVRSIDVKSQRIEYRKSVENKGFPGVGACQRTGSGSRIFSFYG